MARQNSTVVDNGYDEYPDGPRLYEIERVNSADSTPPKSFTKRYMPNSRTFRNAPGKASKAASRGASKMASAFVSTGKKLRFSTSKSKPQNEDGAQVLGAPDESLYILGSEETNSFYPEHTGLYQEDTSGLLCQGQKSSYSTPSTERPTDIEGLDRSDHSGGQPSDNSATSGSDSERERQQKVPATVVTKPQPVEWNHKAFRDCRPLTCDSIWDIPTSRLPQPEPRPDPSPTRAPREQQRGRIEAFGSDSLPPLSPDTRSFGGGRRQLPKLSVSRDLEVGRSTSRTQRGPLRRVCLCVAGVGAAGAVVAAAMHFL